MKLKEYLQKPYFKKKGLKMGFIKIAADKMYPINEDISIDLNLGCLCNPMIQSGKYWIVDQTGGGFHPNTWKLLKSKGLMELGIKILIEFSKLEYTHEKVKFFKTNKLANKLAMQLTNN